MRPCRTSAWYWAMVHCQAVGSWEQQQHVQARITTADTSNAERTRNGKKLKKWNENRRTDNRVSRFKPQTRRDHPKVTFCIGFGGFLST